MELGKKRLSAIKVHFKQYGIDARPHGNCHRQPINAFSPADVERVTNFVTSYAEDHAVLLPGRIPGYNWFDIKLLPSSTTKLSILESYKLTVDQLGHRVVGYKLFRNIWNKYLPFIIVTKPMLDLCWTCQKNNTMIQTSSNKTESQALRAAEEHLTALESAVKPFHVRSII